MPSFSRDGDVQHTTPQLTLKYAYDRISGEGARASCEDRTPGDEREDGRASHEHQEKIRATRAARVA